MLTLCWHISKRRWTRLISGLTCLKSGGEFWKGGRVMSRLGNLLADNEAEYRAMIAGLSRNDLVAHLRQELGKAIKTKVENPFHSVARVKQLLVADPALALAFDFDPRIPP